MKITGSMILIFTLLLNVFYTNSRYNILDYLNYKNQKTTIYNKKKEKFEKKSTKFIIVPIQSTFLNTLFYLPLTIILMLFIQRWIIHNIKQTLITINIMVNYIICRYLIKQSSCTHYFCLLNRSEL